MAGIGFAVKGLAAAVGFLAGQGVAAVVARLAISIAASYALAKRGYNPGLASRGVTLRGTVEPQAKIYGATQVSGPVFWNDAAGTRNSELWVGVLLAGHEVDAITDIWLDDNKVSEALINGGAAGGGGVTAGKYAPINGNDVLQVWKHLGTSTQAANASMVSAFAGWTTAHQLRGIAYMAVRMRLWDKSERVWPRAPQNYRALVRGAKIYDPRLDSTQTGLTPAGSGTHRYDDPTTWAWSENPALCVADYLIDARFGMGLDPTRIDWQSVLDAADHCEETVSVPSGTEDRFTCNGVVYGTTTHRENLAALLSSMNGEVTVAGGQWFVHAGEYRAPADSFTADDVVAPLAIRANRPRGQRVNTLRGVFIDPASNYKATETPPIYTTALRSRDNDQVLERELDLPFTNSAYMAQRVLWKQLHMAAQEKSINTTMNLKASTVKIADRLNLTVDELGWAPNVVKLENWRLVESGDDLGVEVELREDSASAYADPAVGNYSTVSSAGVITFGSPGVDPPANLTATAVLQGILLEFDVPEGNQWSAAILYASSSSSWAGATEIWRGRANRYLHRLDTGQQRWYWVRIDDRGELSVRDPDSDTSTVQATAGAIDYSDVSGGPPANAGPNAPDLSGVVFNSAMNIQDTERDRPAGWFLGDGTLATLGYFDTAKTQMALYSGGADSTVSVSSAAFPVNPDTTYQVRVRLRHRGASARTVYVRMAEYDSALPDGVLAIQYSGTPGPSYDSALMVARTRFVDLSGAFEAPTTFTEYTYTYTPTATALWASICLLNWDSGVTDQQLVVDRVTVEPLSTRNTGALADQDTVSYANGDIENDYSASSVSSNRIARLTTTRTTTSTSYVTLWTINVTGTGEVRFVADYLSGSAVPSSDVGGFIRVIQNGVTLYESGGIRTNGTWVTDGFDEVISLQPDPADPIYIQLRNQEGLSMSLRNVELYIDSLGGEAIS